MMPSARICPSTTGIGTGLLVRRVAIPIPVSHAQVEELQQKVRVLQAVGYGTMEAEDGADAGAAASLEAALLAKARRLEHELTMARLRIAELSGEAVLHNLVREDRPGAGSTS